MGASLTLGACGDDDVATMDAMVPDASVDGGGLEGMPGVTVDPADGLTTTEAGGQAMFTVVLDGEPTADVTIGLSSSDEGEGAVSPSSLTFTNANWNAPQTVTVTGVDDEETDGDQTYEVLTAAAISDDDRFDGLDGDDVSLTNTDDETAGITVTPTEGLEVSESGSTDEFTLVLNAQPTAIVTIALSSSDEGEGTVAPESLEFTTENWDAPQTVTVTGVDDDDADGPQVFSIVTAAAESDDETYSGLDADDVEVTTIDDETAGVTVTPTEGLETTEAGGTDTFTVVLNSRPAADVTIPVDSSDEGEGTVSPDSLTFTPANWDAPQTVTVTGIDDAIADGAQVYQAVLGAATSSDAGYDGFDATDVEISNVDDDSAGVSVDVDDGITTTEAATTDTFSVVLNSRPTDDVTIPVTSGDDTEGAVSPASLTFTSDNWNAPQTVTVTGVDDSTQDGDQVYSIALEPATSADAGYDGFDPLDVSATNVDDDSAGVTVAPLSGLSVSEAGGTDTFTVVLNSRPTANVLFTLSSGDTSEGTVAPPSLTFTRDNWDAPQTVTVTGVDDATEDGDQVFTIAVGAATSPDPDYDGFDPPDVSATNVDDDSAGVTVAPLAGLSVSEAGGTDTFTVVLNSRPTADVSFAIGSSDPGEGTASPSSLTFTTANWDAPQTVTVTGVDDPADDGNQTFTITVGTATSGDSDYDGIDPPNVEVTNTDNDSPGVTVTPTSGLVTTEAGGMATFTVVLNSQPSGDVTIPMASSDPDEGAIAPTALTFTDTNWNAPRTVTITGQPDAVFDGDQPYTILLMAASSTDGGYDGFDPTDVSVVNDDLDPGVRVTPTSGLVTTEAGGEATFEVVLNVAPTSNVQITLASGDAGEGTVLPLTLTFTPANWNAPQTVTVTGQDDAVADGDQIFTVDTSSTMSTQPAYNGLPVADVEVTNEDDETAGFQLQAPPPRETTETGGTFVFRVRLRSEPLADVTLPLESSDTGEGTVGTPSLTFTSANWNAFQNVTVTGIDDLVADGDQPYVITTLPATSSDAAYDGLNPSNLTLVNIDNESAGFEVDPLSVITREDATALPTFRVRLNSQPTGDVTIPVSTSDATEGEADVTELAFTNANWNAFQTVTVTGQDDAVADGDQPYTIVLGPASSTDAGYDTLDPPNVAGVNVDNDSPGITVTPRLGLVTDEAGGTDTFEVVLDSQPTADVSIALVSADPGEGTASTGSLTFTPTNWNAPQEVIVTGQDDAVADGDQLFMIVLEPATSADSGYDGLDPVNPLVTNTDDETAGVAVTPTSGLELTETGGTDTFTVVLTSQPTAGVTIGLSSGDPSEGTVSPSSLGFTAANWDAPQTITVTGVNDAVADGDQTFFIITANATSADANYDGLSVVDVEATTLDDETAGVTVNAPARLRTDENGRVDTFTVALTSQPTAAVTIGLGSSDPDEGTVSPSSLVFTAANWNAPQTVTVTGADDFIADGAQNYTIVTAASMSSDPSYAGLSVPDVPARNGDNETPGITVTPTGGLLINESGTATDTFSVRLDSQPLNAVTIPFDTTDTSEGATTVASVTFTSANWDTPQDITVQGADDFVADGNQTFSITVGPATSADSDYDGLSGSSVTVVTLDDETPGITVTPSRDLVTSETGASDDFTVVLNSQPTAAVQIVFSWDTSEGSLDAVSLSFDDTNWNTPQMVTVTGEDDALTDGSQAYSIVGDPASSSDPDYAGLAPFSVRVINIDDD